jgi:hypothetical protein
VNRTLTFSFTVLASLVALSSFTRAAALDSITFGDARSEQEHQLAATRSEAFTGGLEQSARKLLPLEPPTEYGGHVTFTMKVDPDAPNYFTLKLWGSDAGEASGRLLLFCEGKQVGVRHIGDVDACLDILSDAPRYPGRFTYVTAVLPKAMTKGRQSVSLEVRSLGRIWGYGDTWDKFQKNAEQPSRGIYRAYTHTDAAFVPAADERQGAAPAKPPVRTEPGPEVLDEMKDRVNAEITRLLAAKSIHQMQMQLLARV